MKSPEAWAHAVQLLALMIPATLAITAIGAPRRALTASGVAVGLVVLFIGAAAWLPGPRTSVGTTLAVRVDAITCVMLLLVSTIGFVIVRYSRTYLHGDPGLARYLRWMLLLLGAVTTLVLSNHLLGLALAWTATSLALHQLLTFCAGRTAALVAAHKKFLVSRLADSCLVGCLALVHSTVGSLDLDRIAAWAGSHPELTPSMQVAAVLVVIAVALKSAQLPFHGWLMQVMEAPTPVSALLHAGVVNIGGFVLIRLAPWMAHAASAQRLLVVIGLVSSVGAALVMTTRVSVKVALAWSTCAQMGFMLVECGLGLWPLAMLHLVAHSLYKAHAFLSTGTAVDRWRLHGLAKRRPLALAIAIPVAVGTAALAVVVLHQITRARAGDLSVPVLAILVSLSIVPLLGSTTRGLRSAGLTAVRVLGVALLYVGAHAAAMHWIPLGMEGADALNWTLVGVGLGGLFAVKTMLQVRPQGRLARAVYPWLFAGFYLDERFTRLTFRVWPPRLEAPGKAPARTASITPVEVRS